ncbi:hypothetical protein TWF696_007813 [Orbilia brochopaga]|uniref:Uncharacterized protein n=1 Tax=Orbilia brochopaga TaxID=3140254 RepID=A0AAV9UL90_9PEZI
MSWSSILKLDQNFDLRFDVGIVEIHYLTKFGNPDYPITQLNSTISPSTRLEIEDRHIGGQLQRNRASPFAHSYHIRSGNLRISWDKDNRLHQSRAAQSRNGIGVQAFEAQIVSRLKNEGPLELFLRIFRFGALELKTTVRQRQHGGTVHISDPLLCMRDFPVSKAFALLNIPSSLDPS